ncbi:hypothetical protein CPB84DRAFT_1750350 [Gymnopilus junonius]|uniref:Uncharacterized protein n=1 Tax=Gymnopilus junonius TaxID=109634 RepID=A0A9P5TIG1_GYMJU|nr:hypothetical protein CPB84DRAFT_1750350 [Gymnopilus junonius]
MDFLMLFITFFTCTSGKKLDELRLAWYTLLRLRMIFERIKLLSVHIVRHQSIWAQLVFKTTTSDTKEASNAWGLSPMQELREKQRKGWQTKVSLMPGCVEENSYEIQNIEVVAVNLEFRKCTM